MPKVPSLSPATERPTTPGFIHTINAHFVDTSGRTLLLRGVNLSGSSKLPVGKPSYVLDRFWEDGESGGCEFIGRPLDLDDGSADLHLARLRGWGFNLLRFPVTWEALEHQGPYVATLSTTFLSLTEAHRGKYDEQFLDYIVQVLRKCKEYGFRVYIDPHQDNVRPLIFCPACACAKC